MVITSVRCDKLNIYIHTIWYTHLNVTLCFRQSGTIILHDTTLRHDVVQTRLQCNNNVNTMKWSLIRYMICGCNSVDEFQKFQDVDLNSINGHYPTVATPVATSRRNLNRIVQRSINTHVSRIRTVRDGKVHCEGLK